MLHLNTNTVLLLVHGPRLQLPPPHITTHALLPPPPPHTMLPRIFLFFCEYPRFMDLARASSALTAKRGAAVGVARIARLAATAAGGEEVGLMVCCFLGCSGVGFVAKCKWRHAHARFVRHKRVSVNARLSHKLAMTDTRLWDCPQHAQACRDGHRA